MVKGTGVPDLDKFLEASARGNNGPCIYVRNTTPEQRAEIKAKIDAGIRRWTPFEKWLAAQDSRVLACNIAYHFNNGHEDER